MLERRERTEAGERTPPPAEKAFGLRTSCQQEVAQRAALDADEEPVDLEERSDGGDEVPAAAAEPGGPVPVEVPLIDVAMVEARERKAPAEAPMDGEAGALQASISAGRVYRRTCPALVLGP